MNKQSGILDPIKDKLAPEIWGYVGVMKPAIKTKIIEKIHELVGTNYSEVFALGSTTGYQYSDDSDLDINVTVPFGMITPELDAKRKDINGFLAPGTSHPINLFLQSREGNTPANWQDAVFGVYDVLADSWVVKPHKELNVAPQEYFKIDLMSANIVIDEFIKLSKEYFVKKRLYETTLKLSNPEHETDYYYYDLRLERLKKQMYEAAQKVYDYAKNVDTEREMEYDWGWGIPRINWRNLVFKLMEGSPYGKFFETVKELKDDQLNNFLGYNAADKVTS